MAARAPLDDVGVVAAGELVAGAQYPGGVSDPVGEVVQPRPGARGERDVVDVGLRSSQAPVIRSVAASSVEMYSLQRKPSDSQKRNASSTRGAWRLRWSKRNSGAPRCRSKR